MPDSPAPIPQVITRRVMACVAVGLGLCIAGTDFFWPAQVVVIIALVGTALATPEGAKLLSSTQRNWNIWVAVAAVTAAALRLLTTAVASQNLFDLYSDEFYYYKLGYVAAMLIELGVVLPGALCVRARPKINQPESRPLEIRTPIVSVQRPVLEGMPTRRADEHSVAAGDPAMRLKRVEELFQAGLISESERQEARARLIRQL